MVHVGKNTRSRIVSKGISAGRSVNCYRGLVQVQPTAVGARNYSQCDSMLIGDRAGANTYPYIQVWRQAGSKEGRRCWILTAGVRTRGGQSNSKLPQVVDGAHNGPACG